MWRLRLALETDVPALREMIPLSVRVLSAGHYSAPQIESSIRYVFGVDTQLIVDRTYFVVDDAATGTIAGCGGWSKRRTLFGGDQMKVRADPLLDPATDAARIRAFFVHPDFARRGAGSLLMEACFRAVQEAGFMRMELAATLPGVPLYRRWGFEVVERFDHGLPDGVIVPFVRMKREVSLLGR